MRHGWEARFETAVLGSMVYGVLLIGPVVYVIATAERDLGWASPSPVFAGGLLGFLFPGPLRRLVGLEPGRWWRPGSAESTDDSNDSGCGGGSGGDAGD